MAECPAVERVLTAARKIEQQPGHYPTHLGGCIGVLSQPSCSCGIADLHFAIRALDQAPSTKADTI